MRVVIPAEASLDVLKGAYALWRTHNLRVSDLEIVYPNNSFRMFAGDAVISVFVDPGNVDVLFFDGYRDVIQHLGNPPELSFLEHIPTQVAQLYRGHDKALVFTSIFSSFTAFDKNMRETAELPTLYENRQMRRVGPWGVVIADKNAFLSPEERLRLFRADANYIVFASGNTVGVQKCTSKRCPLLRDLYNGVPSQHLWFAHRQGHLLITKSGSQPPVTVDELGDILCAYLEEKLPTTGARNEL